LLAAADEPLGLLEPLPDGRDEEPLGAASPQLGPPSAERRLDSVETLEQLTQLGANVVGRKLGIVAAAAVAVGGCVVVAGLLTFSGLIIKGEPLMGRAGGRR